MEIFGIPVFLIIAFVIAFLIDSTRNQQKKNEQIAKKWHGVATGMDKETVIRNLGQPHRVWQAGSAEIWSYGPSDSDGQIKFFNGQVTGFQRPV